VPIRNIIFDLGNVLIHCDLEYAVHEIASRSSMTDSEIREKLTSHSIIDEFDEGLHTPEEFAELMRDQTGWQGTTPELEAIWQQMLYPDEPTFAYMESLIERGYDTYILSNANPFHVDHVKETYPRILQTLGQIFSCEVKLIKPNEAIFLHTREVFGIEPTESVFIDDKLANVLSAQRVGFRGIVHRSLEQTKTELEEMLKGQ
jgi:HAD superfamily hydrolase (TIGR01509 family)